MNLLELPDLPVRFDALERRIAELEGRPPIIPDTIAAPNTYIIEPEGGTRNEGPTKAELEALEARVTALEEGGGALKLPAFTHGAVTGGKASIPPEADRLTGEPASGPEEDPKVGWLAFLAKGRGEKRERAWEMATTVFKEKAGEESEASRLYPIYESGSATRPVGPSSSFPIISQGIDRATAADGAPSNPTEQWLLYWIAVTVKWPGGSKLSNVVEVAARSGRSSIENELSVFPGGCVGKKAPNDLGFESVLVGGSKYIEVCLQASRVWNSGNNIAVQAVALTEEPAAGTERCYAMMVLARGGE